MKTTNGIFASCLVLFLIAIGSSNAFSQIINKASLLKELNNTDGMVLDENQKKEFDAINLSTANSLLELDNKELPKKERDKEVDRIFDKRDKDVEGLLGIGNLVEDTRKAYRKKTRGLRLKIKSAKLVL